jgi:hypothetical protein
MADRDRVGRYEPLTVVRLADLLRGAGDSLRWRLVAEFLEEYRWEPPETRIECWSRSRPVPATSVGMCSSRR